MFCGAAKIAFSTQYSSMEQEGGSYSMRISANIYACTLPIESITPLNLQPPANGKFGGGVHIPPHQSLSQTKLNKYLGAYLDPANNNRKDSSYRVSQAISASKLLKPLVSHSCLPPSWKLTVHRSLVLSILTYAMANVLLTSPRSVNWMLYISIHSAVSLKSNPPFTIESWNHPQHSVPINI